MVGRYISLSTFSHSVSVDNDGAEPSANSTALRNLIVFDSIAHATDVKLLGINTDVADNYAQKAEKLLSAFGTALKEHPTSMPDMVSSAVVLEQGIKTVIISGNGDAIGLVDDITGRRWAPDLVFVREYTEGPLTARVCAGGTCGMKQTKASDVREELKRIKSG